MKTRAYIASAALKLRLHTSTTTATGPIQIHRVQLFCTTTSRPARGIPLRRLAPKFRLQAQQEKEAATKDWIEIQSQTIQNRSPLVNLSFRRRFVPSPLPEIPDGYFPGFTTFRVQQPGSRFVGILRNEPAKPNQFFDSQGLPNMHSYVQIFATPTADTPGACLLLHFDNNRYFFGHVSEGTQRLAVQRGLGLTKVSDIFLTGPVNSHNTAGLLGMILTIADVHGAARTELIEGNKKRMAAGRPEILIEKTSLNIHGGKNLTHMLASGRFFVLRNNFPVKPCEILTDPRAQDASSSKPDYEDPLIRVWNLPLVRTSSAVSDGNPRKRRRSNTPAPGQEVIDEQKLRESVVKAMFDSDWKLDNLWECYLSEVKMPAAVFVRDEDGRIQKFQGVTLPDQDGFVDKKVLVRRPWPAVEIQEIPKTTPSYDSMCYIVKEQPRRGKFLPQKAKELGVPPFLNKNLTWGETVTLDNGVVVTPEQVMEPPVPSSAFAIIDIRDPTLLDSLVTRPEWSNPEIASRLVTVYWVLEESVLHDPRLAQFMNSFPTTTQHRILGHQISPNFIAYQGAAEQTVNLSRLDQDRFPLPIYSNETAQLPSTFPKTACVGRPGEMMRLSPRVEFIETEVVNSIDPRALSPKGLLRVYRPREIFSLAKAARGALQDKSLLTQIEESERDIPQRDVEIITLGTGSSLPSKNRNVSATLLRIPGWGTCLLDCGENTMGQMQRTFGYEETEKILKELRFIYISHLHADHHLGTTTVLSTLAKLQTPDMEPVTIICPKKYTNFLDESRQLEDLGRYRWVVRGPGHIFPKKRVEWEQSPQWIQDNLGLTGLHAVYVDHCVDAMATVFTWPSGLKIAFSGDCRPSVQFAEIGRGAHLLIHECTFDDDRRGDAIAKKHSTISEALSVGHQMQARRILLTHFSQRYPKMQNEQNLMAAMRDDGCTPPARMTEQQLRAELTQEGEGVANQTTKKQQEQAVVLFAFDHMRVKLGEFQIAAQYLPALRLLCGNDEDADEGSGSESGRRSPPPSKNGGNGKQVLKKGGNGKRAAGAAA